MLIQISETEMIDSSHISRVQYDEKTELSTYSTLTIYVKGESLPRWLYGEAADKTWQQLQKHTH